MSSAIETIKGLTNTYHAYIFGTAFWYSLRALCRIIDPAMVAGWFRSPAQAYLHNLAIEPNDLELYNIRTDAWGLLALALVLLAIADAVPLPRPLTAGSSLVESSIPAASKKPCARAIVAVTVFHHVMTGVGAYQHWKVPTHRTAAMDVGVWGNVFFAGLGVAALRWGLREEGKGKRG
ncbi:hypothetical protein EJ03DRAFT_311369 [Teratosphaeria nubilosa]|uniref:Uncharacterized protein n=1 Tax=Teratosphaeria nubilosa TaxID=161662 RepID=A0A6G1LAM6_9PEZI|nr:hypothetical protein EJ03DRAFT_311369 [Teratosphaeria nubilosa]